MQTEDKVTQLKKTLQAKKKAEHRKEAAADSGLSVGMEAAYQKKLRSIEEKLKKLEEEKTSIEIKEKEAQDKFVRTYAEFENYKKRVSKEKEELARYGSEKIIKEMLPALDSLEKALEHTGKTQEASALAEGVELVLKQLLQALEKFGLSRLDAKGKPFDPNVHEAVSHQESHEYEPNTVMEEFRRGYQLHERVIRPSMVVVAKEPEKKKE